MYVMPAAFAAAVDSSMFAPFSLARRRLMIDANPIFFSSGIAFDVVAPAHAVVVSSGLKLVTPSTVFSVTCANDAAAIDSVPRAVMTDSEHFIKLQPPGRIMLRNAAVPPPTEKFHGSAVVQDEDEEAEKQADR